MRATLRGTTGASLIEMMIGLAILGIVTAGAYTLFINMGHDAAAIAARTEGDRVGNMMMDMLSKDVYANVTTAGKFTTLIESNCIGAKGRCLTMQLGAPVAASYVTSCEVTAPSPKLSTFDFSNLPASVNTISPTACITCPKGRRPVISISTADGRKMQIPKKLVAKTPVSPSDIWGAAICFRPFTPPGSTMNQKYAEIWTIYQAAETRLGYSVTKRTFDEGNAAGIGIKLKK